MAPLLLFRGWPFLFIGWPFFRRTKVGFNLGFASKRGQQLSFTWVALHKEEKSWVLFGMKGIYLNLNYNCRARKEGKETKKSVYQFVTQEELEQLQKVGTY